MRKPDKKRLKNIALYYLKRFESSAENLRMVLKRRIDKYAFQEPDFNKHEAYVWASEIVEEFEKLRYIDDKRFANFKVKAYINAGKSARYIQGKMRQKGVAEDVVESVLEEQEYDQKAAATQFAKKKKIGPFRLENRKENRQKDLQKMVQAGFNYDVALEVLDSEIMV